MTVIVAVTDGDRVCMACDSQGTHENGQKVTMAAPKIVRCGKVLFGPCDGPTINLIRHGMTEDLLAGVENDLAAWVFRLFLPWLRTEQRADKILAARDGLEELRCNILIAAGGRFVYTDNHGHVISITEPFHAIGSARDEARGAMWQAWRVAMGGTEYMIDVKSANAAVAEYIAVAGVEAAIALDSGCGPPVIVEWTEP